jgi:hypothetical protein
MKKQDFTFEELYTVIVKLAAIPEEQRPYYVEQLSQKVSAEKKEKFQASLYELFLQIDAAKAKSDPDKPPNLA